jgi:hypothetical protein
MVAPVLLHLPNAWVNRATQNHLLPGQDRLNNQHLLRPKMPQRWRRLHPLLGELAHACTKPLEVAVAQNLD